MANVWKIGSRWSESGYWKSSILSVFRRNNIVFTGRSDLGAVNRGDYLAIADGLKVVAVAKVLSEKSFKIDKNKLRFRSTDFKDIQDESDLSYAYGVHVKIVDLDQSRRFEQKKRGAFYRTNQEISEKVISLFENEQSAKFDIKSDTYRICATLDQDSKKKSIISPNKYYTIPVYQREYSWHIEQVYQFIADLLTGFWGANEEKNTSPEPLFIGTMQLSYKKFITKSETEQDVIDGQQRLSTILCLIKYLQLNYPNSKLIAKIKTDWLETKVNNGIEESNLEEMLGISNIAYISEKLESSSNSYLRNIYFIKKSFEEIVSKDNIKRDYFENNINEFVTYLLNDVYFVVIETVAGLSKTIKIFNTINTTGLDLNGDDLFKVRLYEYLMDTNKYGEDAFDKISEIYKRVKHINSKYTYNVVTMEMVRSVYQLYIISKYQLPTILYSKSTDTFFTELFDVLLRVQSHHDLKSIGKVELDLPEIDNIVNVITRWNSRVYLDRDQLITQYLIDYSRYGRYGNIAYLLLLGNKENVIHQILRLLARYFFIKSMEFSKVVYEAHSFIYKLYRASLHNTGDEVLSLLQSEIDSIDFDAFSKEHLKKNIVERASWKNIVCLLSAFLDENEANTSIEEINNLFTWGYFDIEHIHANALKSENDGITEEEQNGIGNLMLLEQSINRSIGDLQFNEKKSRSDGNVCYKDSKYATVRKISQSETETWGRNEIIKRRDEEAERIVQFLKNGSQQ